jgi:uncharacterized membrane protein YccC
MDKLEEELKLKLEDLDLSINFRDPALRMAEVERLLKAGESAEEAMQRAENSLKTVSSQMTLIISMLNGLPNAVLTNAEPPELHRLIDVLDVASKHRMLMRVSNGTVEGQLAKLASQQNKIAQKLGKSIIGEKADPKLASLVKQMTKISTALESGKKKESIDEQLKVDEALRHYLIQWALILNTSIPPGSSSDEEVVSESETDDLYQTETTGFVQDFVDGEAPKDQESEWEILGTRNRAALNQNFARELPLEYRATLKDYYERIAK